MKTTLLLSSACLALCVHVTSAAASLVEGSGPVQAMFNPYDYSYGDPRRCTEIARKNNYNMKRFEVLPGFGWDNLRNSNEGQVVSFNYTQCRTTDDGRFLLPDSVSAVPIKTSRVQTFAELISHWTNYTSSTSHSINIDAGLTLTHFSISGKFSSDFEEVKSKQIGDKSVTTRAQVRYVRYAVQLQPDTPLHPVFKGRLLSIAAAIELGYKDQARFLSQLLVRDFGTHVVTKADAGASLEQVDQIQEDWLMSGNVQKSDILAAASFSLFSVFKMSASYETKSDQSKFEAYRSKRTSSNIVTKGGPLFKPVNFTSDMWAEEVDSDLVALDRAGDPLYYVITAATLPELPASILNEVYTQVQEAVETYYQYNRIPGCLDSRSPNFSPGANVEDNTCKPPKTNLIFGGMYQTCTMQPSSNNGDLCAALKEVNPMTGGMSCPTSYMPIKLHTGTTSSSRSEHVCHSYWIFWQKCHDNYYSSHASYDLFWCVNTGTVAQDSGYLFGGLFTSRVDNPVTRSRTCPPTFFPLKVGTGAELQVCISDDYELGQEYSLPFAGFLSCQAGNPLAMGGSGGQGQGSSDKAGSGKSRGGVLRGVFQSSPEEWPMRCPEGYSQHLAMVDQGCQINYCVQTGAMAGPMLPPIKRPPFVPAPPVPAPSTDNLILFDPATNTWKKNSEARTWMELKPAQSSESRDNSENDYNGPPTSSSSTITPGAAAGISVGATLAGVALVAVGVVAVRRRRSRTAAGYRRLDPSSFLDQPPDNYGSVNNVRSAPSATDADA